MSVPQQALVAQLRAIVKELILEGLEPAEVARVVSEAAADGMSEAIPDGREALAWVLRASPPKPKT